MPVAMKEPAAPAPVAVGPPRKKLTRAECAVLETSGLWGRDRFELIEGELIAKMGKKRPHTNTLVLLLGWLIQVFGQERINPETSIDVAAGDNRINQPEPDLIVLAQSTRAYQTNPGPSDILLLIEISDSTLEFDRTVKAALYARAGISDYWVVDIPGRRIFVHRDPHEGTYRSVSVYAEHERVSPLAAPSHSFLVSEAFVA